MDPTQYLKTPEINQMGQEAYNASNTAAGMASALPSLGAKLKEAIQAKLDYNQDLIKQKNEAQANYFAAPSTARVDYQNIWNPFEREKLVTQAQQNAYVPYANMTDILNQRLGTISDVVNQGTGAFQTAAQSAQSNAELLNKKYSTALENAKWGYEQTHAKPSSAAGKSPFEQMIEALILKNLTGGGGNESFVPTEEEPMYSPRTGEGSKSTGGQWIFHNGEWMVNADTGNIGSSAQENDDGFIPTFSGLGVGSS